MFDNRQKHGKASELPILFYPNLVSSHLTCSYCPSEICGLCIIMFRFVWTCTVVISLQRSSAIVFSFSFFFILVSVSGVPVPSCFLCFCVVPFWCYSSNTNGTSFGLMCHVCSRKTAYIFYFFIENGCSFSRWEFDASSCVKIHQFYTHKLFLKSKRQSSAPKQNSSICNLKRPPPARARAPKERTSFGRRAIYVQGSHLSNSRNHVEQNWVWDQWWRWVDDWALGSWSKGQSWRLDVFLYYLISPSIWNHSIPSHSQISKSRMVPFQSTSFLKPLTVLELKSFFWLC